MIGRGSAKTIAEAYNSRFTGTYRSSGYGSSSSTREFIYYPDRLYDFLYVNDFEGWILNAVKSVGKFEKRGLLEFVMQLHTGESCVPGTPDWTWEARRLLGQRFLHDLAASMLEARHNASWNEGQGVTAAVDAMQRQLELDGYVFEDGVLLVPEESVLDEAEEQGVLSGLIAGAHLRDTDTIYHHVALSEEHYRAGRWDDSISNSRKVLEAVLAQTAAAFSSAAEVSGLSQAELERPVRVRDYLEAVELLDRKEKEAISSTYGLLSSTGGHPHVAEKDQARLMRHLALTFSQFVLLRLGGAISDRRS